MKVVDAMSEEIVTIDESASVEEAAKLMHKKNVGSIITLRTGTPIGMITEKNITRQVCAKSLNPKSVKVLNVASSPLITIDPDTDLIDAAKAMEKHQIKRIVVARKKIIYGILSASDIARHLEGYLESEIRKILRYIWPHG